MISSNPDGVRGYFTVPFLASGKFRKVNEWLGTGMALHGYRGAPTSQPPPSMDWD
jgi:hypothetical protein